nr:lytic transglycosylase F [Caldimonas sp.]
MLGPLLVAACAAVAQGQPPAGDAIAPRRLAIHNKPWTGDFDGMLERRVIRVWAPYSRSLYFNDR